MNQRIFVISSVEPILGHLLASGIGQPDDEPLGNPFCFLLEEGRKVFAIKSDDGWEIASVAHVLRQDLVIGSSASAA